MNFKDKMIHLMEQNGMFKSQAEEVMEKVISDHEFGAGTMVGRWGDKISNYPEAITALTWNAVKREALKYIEEKCPQAWFKPMFFDKQTQDQWLRENNGAHLIK